ncbi:endonuclease NucS domain-containing protein [Paenibacillus solisilvae]|uniref:Endonuclease NucS domain-containing protein n=1 Tax=Paenibacillus solisilvae TaxID=2486751 RepID=A0ABW0VS55_9BACL
MNELQLHDILISNSDIIEEGLTFLSREVPIGSYRCDLLYLDRNNKKLYVEVKLKVEDKAVGQLLRYDGLVNDSEARFMLAGLTFVHGLKEGLGKHGYEYKEIELLNRDSKITNKSVIIKPILTKGESKYCTPEDVIVSFENLILQSVVRVIFDYVSEIKDTYYYISDGIMFKRSGRRYKFLSISTVRNRLLFHVPVNRRDEIYDQFKSNISIYLPIDYRDKNQIDIQLTNIHSLDDLIPLVRLAYEERE